MVSPIQRKPEHIIFSDASAYAGAGFIDESILKVAHFMFTEDEKLKSSTWPLIDKYYQRPELKKLFYPTRMLNFLQ
jgi:hypothetical protein